MKRTKQTLIFGCGVLVLIVALVVIVTKRARAFQQLGPDVDLPPTPALKPIDFLSNDNETMSTTSQRVISKVTDLAKGLAEEDKFVYVIQRLDGKYEQFMIPANYDGDIRKLMGLKDKERIVTGFALKPIRSTPVIDKPKPQFTTTPTVPSQPYPPPWLPESSPSRPYPYP